MFEYLKSLDLIQLTAVISAITTIIAFITMIISVFKIRKKYLRDPFTQYKRSNITLNQNNYHDSISHISLKEKKIKVKKEKSGRRGKSRFAKDSIVIGNSNTTQQTQQAADHAKQNQRVEPQKDKQNQFQNTGAENTQAKDTPKDSDNIKQLLGLNSETEPLFINLCKKILNGEVKNIEDVENYYTNSLKKHYADFTLFLDTFSFWLKIETIIHDLPLSEKEIVKAEQIFKNIIVKKDSFVGVSQEDRMSLIQQELNKVSGIKSDVLVLLEEQQRFYLYTQEQHEHDRRTNRWALLVSLLGIIASVSGIIASAFFAFSTDKQMQSGFSNVKDVITEQNKNTVDTIISFIDSTPLDSTMMIDNKKNQRR